MDKLIQQLVQIDKDARQVIARADDVKQELDAKYAAKKTDYDTVLSKEVSDKLAALSETLAAQKEKDLSALHGKTAKTLGTLDAEYQAKHAQLADDIVQRVLCMD